MSELGILLKTSASDAALDEAFKAAGVRYTELVQSAPRVALPSSHPMSNAKSLTLDDLADWPYIYFDQGKDVPAEFAEEAVCDPACAKKIATTDRASLSELCVALNGYTVTSGILVGIADGPALTTVPLETDVTIHLGRKLPRSTEEEPRALRRIPLRENGAHNIEGLRRNGPSEAFFLEMRVCCSDCVSRKGCFSPCSLGTRRGAAPLSR